MSHNVGSADRVLRIVLAAAAIIGAFIIGAGSTLGIVLIVIGLVLAATSAIGFCPLYRLLGIDTCRVKS